MAKLTLTDLTAGFGSVDTMNANNALIETALENTLSRDGTSPNSMSANFDLNSNDILNGGTLNAADIVVAGTSLITQVNAAATSAANAATSETNAAASATLASQWASLTGALVAATDYSAKEYATGTTVPAGSAKDWAIEAEDTIVDGGTGYSAYHWAQKALAASASLDLYAGNVAGTDTYTITTGQSLTVYSTGMIINGLVTNANTGAATLNVDSIGAQTITDIDGNALIAGEIAAGSVHLFRYDGTNFQLLNPNTSETNQTIAGNWTFSGTTTLGSVSGEVNITDWLEVGTGMTDQGAGTINAQTGVYVNDVELYTPTAVTNYTSGQNITFHDDTAHNTTFDVDANIGTSFETVGPTGSGATNIWTPLDDVPSTAKAVILQGTFLVRGATNGNTYSATLYARGGDSVAGAGTQTTIAYASFTNRSGSNEQNGVAFKAIVPVDANIIFDLQLNSVGTAPTVVSNMVLVGWIE